jgi:hypothetical protein
MTIFLSMSHSVNFAPKNYVLKSLNLLILKF